MLDTLKKQFPLLLFLGILLLAAFLRIYRISDYMTFLGDEGRDVLVVKQMLEGNLTLLGPRSSAGDFFMGPAYYYMMVPFLWLFRFDPVGPAVMVALVSVATVGLLYVVGKQFFNKKAGLFAAALYAVSPLVITYSHSSWNPNVLPFFSLLLVYILYRAVAKKGTWKHFVFAGFLLGIAIQLHYLALFLIVMTVTYVFVGKWYEQKKIHFVQLTKHYAQLLLGFVIGFSPFLLFEFRHDFLNTKAIFQFIFADTLQGAYQVEGAFLATIWEVFFRSFGRLIFYYPSPDLATMYPTLVLQVWAVVIVLLSFAAIAALYKVKNKAVVLVLSLWLIAGVLLFGLYKKSIYDYHFVILFPLPFLLFGNFLSWLTSFKHNKHVFGVVGSVLLFISLFGFALYWLPFRFAANQQKNQMKTISEFVISKTENKPFNFALITPGNSDHAYRYYFDILGHKPVSLENTINDPQRKSVTDQLLIICEDINCQPLGHSLFEVAGFGRASIAAEWNVSVVKVYRLVPYIEPKE